MRKVDTIRLSIVEGKISRTCLLVLLLSSVVLSVVTTAPEEA